VVYPAPDRQRKNHSRRGIDVNRQAAAGHQQITIGTGAPSGSRPSPHDWRRVMSVIGTSAARTLVIRSIGIIAAMSFIAGFTLLSAVSNLARGHLMYAFQFATIPLLGLAIILHARVIIAQVHGTLRW
jgi:hypothetical protein